jgi:GH15 family glucan-1,4-alpha-glucosidase
VPGRIEDYALIGNTRTAALVGRDGSIDWLCPPRFDSPACFAALLGKPEHGRWLLAPAGEVRRARRSYRDGTLVLDSEYETADGAVRVVDCMPMWEGRTDVVRLVRGLRGRVPMRMELVIRFDYGSTIPWVERRDGGLRATAGPDTLDLRALRDVELRGEEFQTVAEFDVAERETVPFTLSHYVSHEEAPIPIDPFAAIRETERWWRDWSGRCRYQGEWRDLVVRSLITLKALTYAPSGGIVAAPTSSLPEQLGGVRNWDYRFCWLRDATFTLYALLLGGYRDEARDWREWLLRVGAGHPADLQILYGVAGERRLPELELDWLPGYEGSTPVRMGNAASQQFQLDVYGEVLDALHLARAAGLPPDSRAWNFEKALVHFVESSWSEPDDGIWEVRGPRRHFTHSKVMAWVAMDRAVKAVKRFRLEGPTKRWTELRDRIHAEVCEKGFDAERGSFVQSYGAKALDASLLLMPLVGFLPADDERVRGTVAAIEKHLIRDGWVRRYETEDGVDGLPAGEGVFLPCSFWLADNWVLQGRTGEARALFERLVALCSDVGLLSEEYDPEAERLVGNFPQAFSHVMLVNTARNLERTGGPCERRVRSEAPDHPESPENRDLGAPARARGRPQDPA